MTERRRLGLPVFALAAIVAVAAGALLLPGGRDVPVPRLPMVPTQGGGAPPQPAGPRLRWTWEAGGPVQAAPAIAGDTVFVATAGGVLARLDLADGRERWRLAGGGVYAGGPLLRDGVLFIGDEAGVVRAVDAASGTLRWARDLGGKIASAPTATPDGLLVGTYGCALFHLAASDGTVRWSVPTGSYQHAAAALSGEEVVISGCDGTVRCLALADGRELGRHQEPDDNFGAAAVCRDGIAWTGSIGGALLAVELPAGGLRWRRSGGIGEIHVPPAIVDGVAVFVGRSGGVLGLTAADGSPRWRAELGATADAPPVLRGDQVVVGADDGTLRGLALADGAERWRFAAGGAIAAASAGAGDWLVIACGDGSVRGLIFDAQR